MQSIDTMYSEYCKRHEDAVLKLQELEIIPEVQEFFNVSKNKIDNGKTCILMYICIHFELFRAVKNRSRERQQVGIWVVY